MFVNTLGKDLNTKPMSINNGSGYEKKRREKN